jgi:hypothetical protein
MQLDDSVYTGERDGEARRRVSIILWIWAGVAELRYIV